MINGDKQLLVKLFVALRGRGGLSAEKLQARPQDASILTDLDVVRAQTSSDIDLSQAAVRAANKSQANWTQLPY